MENHPKVKLGRDFYSLKSTVYMSNRFQDRELSDICKKILNSDFDSDYIGYKNREPVQFNEKNNENTIFTIIYSSRFKFNIKLKYIKGAEASNGIRHPFYIISGNMSLDGKSEGGKYITGIIKDRGERRAVKKKKDMVCNLFQKLSDITGLSFELF